MSDDPLPAETDGLLAELATIGSFAIGERTPFDWPAIEMTLGISLPSQYKAYVECFPPGVFRLLHVFHPAMSESPPWPEPWGLVEEVKELSSMLKPWDESRSPRYRRYPESGGLIPWADFNADYFLCWLPSDENPDRWPVVAYAADKDDNSEVIEGSTLQALIRVIRGDAGRSVFPRRFYNEPMDFLAADPANG